MKNVCAFLAVLALGVSAQAAEGTAAVNESKTTLKDTAATKKANDLDAEVTDIKMRADSGAKSKYSTSFYMIYNGGSLSNPGSDERPNVAGGRGGGDVSLAGQVGVRYRQNKNNSFFMATGVSRPRPFHSREEDDEWEVSTPHVAFNRTHAVDDIQVSSSVRAYVMTEDRNRDIGQLTTVGYSLIAKNKIAQSRWSGGVSMNLGYTFYDGRNIDLAQLKRSNRQYAGRYRNYNDIEEVQPDYTFSLSPAIQYHPNDRAYIYTSLSLLSNTHYRADKPFRMSNDNVTQSLGLGYAVMRDFYLSPYVTFEPENTSRDRTAVNLNATINL